MATIHDLLTRTDLMVRIENKEQANKLQDAGVKFNYYYYEQYYGLTYRFELLSIEEEQGRTLVPFDEIDFGVKEENRITHLESEIARLKREVQNWKDSYNGLFRRSEELEKSTPLAVLESTTDLEKRERMAWEIWLQGRYTVEQAIEKVNHFLEESKEVKNEQ